MNKRDTAFLEGIVNRASNCGCGYDMSVEIYETGDDFVMVRSFNHDEPDEEVQQTESVTAKVTIVSDEVLEVTVYEMEPVRISPHGWVLNAILYCVP